MGETLDQGGRLLLVTIFLSTVVPGVVMRVVVVVVVVLVLVVVEIPALVLFRDTEFYRFLHRTNSSRNSNNNSNLSLNNPKINSSNNPNNNNNNNHSPNNNNNISRPQFRIIPVSMFREKAMPLGPVGLNPVLALSNGAEVVEVGAEARRGVEARPCNHPGAVEGRYRIYHRCTRLCTWLQQRQQRLRVFRAGNPALPSQVTPSTQGTGDIRVILGIPDTRDIQDPLVLVRSNFEEVLRIQGRRACIHHPLHQPLKSPELTKGTFCSYRPISRTE